MSGVSRSARLIARDWPEFGSAERPAAVSAQELQQRIETLLQRLLIPAALTQSANEFRDHLLEDGRVIRQFRSVNG